MWSRRSWSCRHEDCLCTQFCHSQTVQGRRSIVLKIIKYCVLLMGGFFVVFRRFGGSYLSYVATSVERKTEDHIVIGNLGSAVWVIQVQAVTIITQRVQVRPLNHDVHVVWGAVHSTWHSMLLTRLVQQLELFLGLVGPTFWFLLNYYTATFYSMKTGTDMHDVLKKEKRYNQRSRGQNSPTFTS